jgi:hypothetical protein
LDLPEAVSTGERLTCLPVDTAQKADSETNKIDAYLLARPKGALKKYGLFEHTPNCILQNNTM